MSLWAGYVVFLFFLCRLKGWCVPSYLCQAWFSRETGVQTSHGTVAWEAITQRAVAAQRRGWRHGLWGLCLH